MSALQASPGVVDEDSPLLCDVLVGADVDVGDPVAVSVALIVEVMPVFVEPVVLVALACVVPVA
ncbi:MAG TPA: hypothetical protein ENJ18_11340 [Nannocystis exedens]|nr:hypothetical protein [Nannocystis exedens]